VAVHIVDGLQFNVERGPNWLFVKLRTKQRPLVEVPQFAEKLWSIASRHFIYRLVLELDELEKLPSGMMAQLVLLQERLAQCGGALRICGLSPECEEALQSFHLDSALYNSATREQAVMGSGEYVVARR
jgi:anti-anti-sigma regulatory factor